MKPISETIIQMVNVNLCTRCPRRSLLGKINSGAILGVDYAAVGCTPDDIVHDENLKNRIYKEGIVASPVGAMLTPNLLNATEAQPTKVVMLSPSIPNRLGLANIRFGFSDAICPRDLPGTKRG